MKNNEAISSVSYECVFFQMILFVVMIPRLLEYEYYGSMGYVYPPKARALGVIVAIGPLIFDLIGAIHALVTAPGNIEMVSIAIGMLFYFVYLNILNIYSTHAFMNIICDYEIVR